jgi:hypothetical protein
MEGFAQDVEENEGIVNRELRMKWCLRNVEWR